MHCNWSWSYASSSSSAAGSLLDFGVSLGRWCPALPSPSSSSAFRAVSSSTSSASSGSRTWCTTPTALSDWSSSGWCSTKARLRHPQQPMEPLFFIHLGLTKILWLNCPRLFEKECDKFFVNFWFRSNSLVLEMHLMNKWKKVLTASPFLTSSSGDPNKHCVAYCLKSFGVRWYNFLTWVLLRKVLVRQPWARDIKVMVWGRSWVICLSGNIFFVLDNGNSR